MKAKHKHNKITNISKLDKHVRKTTSASKNRIVSCKHHHYTENTREGKQQQNLGLVLYPSFYSMVEKVDCLKILAVLLVYGLFLLGF